MTIMLTPKTKVHAFWTFGDEHGDMIAALWCTEEGEWRFDARLRTNSREGNPDPTSPKNEDRKTWWGGPMKAGADLNTEFEKLRGILLEIAAHRTRMYGTRVDFEELLLVCAGDKAAEVIASKSWAHVVPTAPGGDA